MKIIFVLPMITNNPAGGYKVIYEYANRLAERGYTVTIYYYCMILKKSFVPVLLQRIARIIISKVRLYVLHYPKWFGLNNNIKLKLTYGDIDDDGNAIIATSYHTTSVVDKSNIEKKLYMIQDFENWYGVTDDEVKKTYRLGMKNIVIANWLKKIVDDATKCDDSIIIENGIDLSSFNIEIPILQRKTHSVAMLYHSESHKGSKYGLSVIKKLHDKYPDLKVDMFGTCDFYEKDMKYVVYHKNVNPVELKKLYNRNRVYIYPTLKEGFGLTCVEAMACGCALCVTDYDGAKSFAINRKTAMVSPIKDVDEMVKNVVHLFEDDSDCEKMSLCGFEYVKKYDWNNSVDKMELVLKGM